MILSLEFDSEKKRQVFKNKGLIKDTITNRGDIHLQLIT